MCGGTGRTEPTALDCLDLAETGVMDLQCLACDGGQSGSATWATGRHAHHNTTRT